MDSVIVVHIEELLFNHVEGCAVLDHFGRSFEVNSLQLLPKDISANGCLVVPLDHGCLEFVPRQVAALLQDKGVDEIVCVTCESEYRIVEVFFCWDSTGSEIYFHLPNPVRDPLQVRAAEDWGLDVRSSRRHHSSAVGGVVLGRHLSGPECW